MEALAASVIFLMAMTAVTTLIVQSAKLQRRGSMNTEMAQVVRDQLHRRTLTKAASSQADEFDAGVNILGVVLHRDTQSFDTSGTVGSEAAAQFPGCANTAIAGSRCVRVVVTDWASGASYISASYVY
jgi:hypothetical protein